MAKKSKYTIGELIGKLIENKQDKINYIGGLLGTYDQNGDEVVDVLNRNGYSYVRLNGNQSEVIEAFNPGSLSEYDLKVLVVRSDQGNYYEIVGRDVQQYSEWERNSFIGQHGYQHQFGTGENEGADPVFIYKRQLLQPMGVHPTSTGINGLTATVEPDFYNWNNTITWFPGEDTLDLTPLKPDDQGARYVTVYLDGNTGHLGYETGTLFYNLFYNTGTLDNIPEVSLQKGIPLAGIYLTSGTSSIEWDNLFDIRNFLNQGGQTTTLHDLDPQYGYHTGTLRAGLVLVTGSSYYTGSSLENILNEIYPTTTGTIISVNNLNIGNTKKINFQNGLNTVVSGTLNNNQVDISVYVTGTGGNTGYGLSFLLMGG